MYPWPICRQSLIGTVAGLPKYGSVFDSAVLLRTGIIRFFIAHFSWYMLDTLIT